MRRYCKLREDLGDAGVQGRSAARTADSTAGRNSLPDRRGSASVTNCSTNVAAGLLTDSQLMGTVQSWLALLDLRRLDFFGFLCAAHCPYLSP